MLLGERKGGLVKGGNVDQQERRQKEKMLIGEERNR